MTRFRWGLATDVGRVRSANQDNALAIEGLFAVADGLGGHRGGEVASELAVRALRERAPLLSSVDLIGMGTTLCVLALVDADGEERLAVANVGDSRIYLFANGELEQMTDDHSLVAALVREGRITEQEAEEHPQRNILTRALGIDHQVAVDAWEVAPYVGDRWVLCSDGLFNEVSVDQMASVLRRLADPEEAARELVRLANDGGGRDNITVLVVDLVDDEGHAVISSTGGAETANGSPDDGDLDSIGLLDDDTLADAAPPLAPKQRSARPRFTWRVALFILALLVLVGVVIGAFAYYGTDDDTPPPTTPVPSTSTTTSTTLPATTTTAVPTTVPVAPTQAPANPPAAG